MYDIQVLWVNIGWYYNQNLIFILWFWRGIPARENGGKGKFKKLASSKKFRAPLHKRHGDLLEKYWESLDDWVSPIYGSEVAMSLMDPGTPWNLDELRTLLDQLVEKHGHILGVTKSYLYVAMYKTTFAWHTEDADLYSINYLHFGEPKCWIDVAPNDGRELEALAKRHFPEYKCDALIRGWRWPIHGDLSKIEKKWLEEEHTIL